ncbi:MAG: molybdopterin-synthase adenylyltransferase MoeB [Planctomycetes bacterium]|nr:molybdopterin-synthase adenylyltransferase MoeB [Planctomycetota bacterium]
MNTEQYSRHIRLPGFGTEGQKKIESARVLVVGAGGLGSPAITYLAGAGVGLLGITDDDTVELSNLPRQILHTSDNVDQPKITSAEQRVRQLNSAVKVKTYPQRLKAENVLTVIKDFDIIIDGSDNFATKFLLNDACVIGGKPLVHGGVLRYNGQVMTIVPNQKSRSACYRCIFPEPPQAGTVPNCSEAGILNTVAGVIGLIQATEAIKFIINVGDLLINRLLVFDALSMNFRTIEIKPDATCPACGKNPRIKTLSDLKEIECKG